jgi:LysM repeat protein
MNSIRPLITISILIAAGVFLYTKINENPAHLVPEVNDVAQNTSPGVPPLATAPGGAANGPESLTPSPAWNGATSSPGGAAPQWPASDPSKTCPVPQLPGGTASSGPPSTTNPATSSSTAISPDSLSLPEVPKIPDLPSFPTTPEVSTSPTAPSGLANNPPTVSPLSLNPASAQSSIKGDDAKTTSGQNSSLGAPASIGAPATAANSGGDERYGSTSTPVDVPSRVPATPAFPSTSAAPASFATAWPVIQAALAQQELGKAHQMLTEWYGNSTLSPVESEQVQSLLNQLAGTVVYSNQSCLEPPYVVRAGDTLESIAKQYDVPWQLLAKINGIPAADLVQPGQQLKVIHGPFSAAVDLGKGQMTLLVDGRYAGRFSITAEPNAAATEGQWSVEQKLSAPSTSGTGATSSVYAVGPATVDHVLVLKTDSSPGGEISITSGPASPSAPVAAAPPAFRLAPRDADEVADILSVGSRVTIKR